MPPNITPQSDPSALGRDPAASAARARGTSRRFPACRARAMSSPHGERARARARRGFRLWYGSMRRGRGLGLRCIASRACFCVGLRELGRHKSGVSQNTRHGICHARRFTKQNTQNYTNVVSIFIANSCTLVVSTILTNYFTLVISDHLQLTYNFGKSDTYNSLKITYDNRELLTPSPKSRHLNFYGLIVQKYTMTQKRIK